MWDNVLIPVSLVWSKKTKKRTVRESGIAVEGREIELIDGRLFRNNVVKVCELSLVLLLPRLNDSRVCILMMAR